MTTKDTLEQRLTRLGRTLADEVSVADSVMKRVAECGPPGTRRSNRRSMGLFKPALNLGSLVAAALVYEFAKFAGLVGNTGRVLAASNAASAPQEMAIAIGAILLLAVFLSVVFVNVPMMLWRRTHTRRYPLLWIVGVAGAIGFLVGSVAWQWNTAPCPVGINETLEATGGNSPLIILGIRMEPPTGDSGTIELDVRNDGPTQQFLAFAYYTDGGKLGAGGCFKPGAGAGGKVKRVPPHWSGTIEFDVHFPPRFGYGGWISIEIGGASVSQEQDWIRMVPPEFETLYKKRFVLVPEGG